jgi:V/A-type H+/Na+-transporting ATPase subunit I
MIAPMKRSFIVVLEREKREALKALRRLGVLHLEPVQGRGQEHDELAAHKKSFEDALAVLSEYKAPQDSQALSPRQAIDFADEVQTRSEALKATLEEIAGLAREIERVKGWGDFEPALFSELAAKGHSLRLAEAPAKKLAALAAELDLIRLGEAKGKARVALLAAPDRELPQDFMEFHLPAISLSTLESELEDADSRLKSLKGDLAQMAAKADGLRAAQGRLERDLAFEGIRSGIATEGAVAWFSGWVPAKDEKALSAYAAKAGWALLLDDPKDDELPPTKVENNAAVRIIQPIFDFLGTVPNYREFDISLWFLLFFGIFFAMIFGDGGYGVLMLLIALFASFKGMKAGKGVGDGLKLFLFLSTLTVVWGSLTGTWFGLERASIPGFLQVLALEPLASWNPASGDNIKVLCFILGAIQLSVAHLKNAIRDFPKPKFLGQLGSLALVLGMYFMVLNLVVSAELYPIPQFGLYLIAGGFAASFIFGSWETGPIQAILDSLKNIISIFLGTVSFFADIVSYIRLGAVGLAGLAISQAVNGMASGLLRVPVAFAFGAIILVFGHGINLAMGGLSVVVHGVRLNMLEFSGHMNMEWSGYRYEPFKETADE